jgi:hypothetical protein
MAFGFRMANLDPREGAAAGRTRDHEPGKTGAAGEKAVSAAKSPLVA